MIFGQPLMQLEQHKGGYCYLYVDAKVAESFPDKKKTRLICVIDNKLTLRCGLNHLGDGNFFVIVSSKYLKTLDKEPGDTVTFTLEPDPDPLGVDVPEVLQALLDQDEDLKAIYDTFTPGKKRSLIFSIARVKDIDRQVKAILTFFNNNVQRR